MHDSLKLLHLRPQATFNTLFSAALRREIKFKTTEKSIMAADVTDAANKAVKKSKKQRSPLAVLWMSIQACTLQSNVAKGSLVITAAKLASAWTSRQVAQSPPLGFYSL